MRNRGVVAIPAAREFLGALLDNASDTLDRGSAEPVVGLMQDLEPWRAALDHAAFAREVSAPCRRHPLYERLAADPFTHRCRNKPRGYAGDAVTLDAIYLGLTPEQRATVSAEGQLIFAALTGTSGPALAVCERRDLLARELDRIGVQRPGARVLSVACGHLREAARSRCVREGRLAELLALDQDAESLREVQRSAYGACVRTVEASVRTLLTRWLELGTFDFIYAAGLYDYLPQPFATLLTEYLFRHLTPGGELLVGNFLTGYIGAGFLDVFLDWRLITRTHGELCALFASTPRADLARLETFEDNAGFIVYVRATRAGAR